MDPQINVGRLRVFAWQSWGDVRRVRDMNWIDIEWIRVHTELAAYKESFELNVSLLGFNACLDWFYGTYESVE